MSNNGFIKTIINGLLFKSANDINKAAGGLRKEIDTAVNSTMVEVGKVSEACIKSPTQAQVGQCLVVSQTIGGKPTKWETADKLEAMQPYEFVLTFTRNGDSNEYTCSEKTIDIYSLRDAYNAGREVRARLRIFSSDNLYGDYIANLSHVTMSSGKAESFSFAFSEIYVSNGNLKGKVAWVDVTGSVHALFYAGLTIPIT